MPPQAAALQGAHTEVFQGLAAPNHSFATGLIRILGFFSGNGSFYIFVSVLSFPCLQKKTQCVKLAGLCLVPAGQDS